jgi:predicted phage tail protein
MLTTVKLYGHLRKRFGRDFRFDIETVVEAVRALEANCKGFRQYLIEHSEPGYRVIVNGRAIGEAELQFGINIPSEIKIVPAVRGAGDGKGIGQIILGVVLVAVAAVITFGGAAFAAYAGYASILTSVGVGLIAGGVTSLLSPGMTTTQDEPGKQSQSYTLSRAEDTAMQGLPVPIGYGMMMVEGYPVSLKVHVKN